MQFYRNMKKNVTIESTHYKTFQIKIILGKLYENIMHLHKNTVLSYNIINFKFTIIQSYNM